MKDTRFRTLILVVLALVNPLALSLAAQSVHIGETLLALDELALHVQIGTVTDVAEETEDRGAIDSLTVWQAYLHAQLGDPDAAEAALDRVELAGGLTPLDRAVHDGTSAFLAGDDGGALSDDARIYFSVLDARRNGLGTISDAAIPAGTLEPARVLSRYLRGDTGGIKPEDVAIAETVIPTSSTNAAVRLYDPALIMVEAHRVFQANRDQYGQARQADRIFAAAIAAHHLGIHDESDEMIALLGAQRRSAPAVTLSLLNENGRGGSISAEARRTLQTMGRTAERAYLLLALAEAGIDPDLVDRELRSLRGSAGTSPDIIQIDAVNALRAGRYADSYDAFQEIWSVLRSAQSERFYRWRALYVRCTFENGRNDQSMGRQALNVLATIPTTPLADRLANQVVAQYYVFHIRPGTLES